MKPDQCQATAASGKPCSAKPRPGRPYCLWHDPQAQDVRTEISKKGGAARSNRARAAKELGDTLSSDDLLKTLSRAIRKVEAGKLDPGPANAIAGLARAMTTIREATELERRLDALEAHVGLTTGRRGA